MDSLFADFSSLAAMSREKAEKNMQEALNYLGLDMKNIARTMRPYHPLEMLKMAAWEERRIARTKGKDRLQSLYAHLLPVLLQSILQSTLYDTSYPASTNRDIKQKDWNRVLSLAEDSVRRLLKYIESYTVFAVRSGFVSDENAESYRSTLLAQLFPPEEDMESIERYSYLWYGYAFDDEKIIKDKFGTDLKTLLDGLRKIARYGLEGIDKLSEDFSVYKAEMLLLMARKKAEREGSVSDDVLRDEIVQENNWQMRVKDLQARRDDFDLFRPEFAADLQTDVYRTLSRPIGSLDIWEYLKKGLWPATVYPFVPFGSMYFSFVQSHILTYGQRILALNADLYLRDSAAAAAACRLLFSETDMVGVYSFDGNKVDISILSSMTEVNAFENPAFYESRVHQHEEDKHVKAQDGHKLLILDPDSYGPLEKVSDGVFTSSVYYLIKAANSAAGREEFHRTIFGSLELPEKTDILDFLDEDDIDDREVIDDVDDEISDEYEYDSEDDDEKAKAIEEKEKQLEELSVPEYHQVSRSEEELKKLQDKYELTSELIKRDEESDAEADEYERELDDDDYSYEEGDVLPAEDDEEAEDEELYNEVEKEDLYQKDSSVDSDQSDLFDDLFDDPDEESEAELETDVESEEEEEEYEKEEEEATDFASAYVKEQEERHEDSNESASSDDDYIPTAIDEEDPLSSDSIGIPVNDDPTESNEHGSDSAEGEEHADSNPESIGLPQEESEAVDSPDEACACEDDAVTEDDGEEYGDQKPEEESSNSIADEAREEAPDGATDEADTSSDSDDAKDNVSVLVDRGAVKRLDGENQGNVFIMVGNGDGTASDDFSDLAGVVKEIAEKVGSNSAFVGFVRSSDKDMHLYLEDVIKRSWNRQREDGKDKMFSIFDYSLSILIASKKVVMDDLRMEELLNNAGAVMYSRHANSWNSLILSFDDDYTLLSAEEKKITPSSFSPSNWKICRIVGEQLIARGKEHGKE